jgi:hypothetical protein
VRQVGYRALPVSFLLNFLTFLSTPGRPQGRNLRSHLVMMQFASNLSEEFQRMWLLSLGAFIFSEALHSAPRPPAAEEFPADESGAALKERASRP